MDAEPIRRPPILRPDRLPLIPGAFALVAAWLALTPSLLPRAAVFQGVLCAVAALLGYGLGSVVHWALHGAARPLPAPTRRRLNLALAGLAVLGSVVMLWSSHTWQQAQRAEIGMSPASWTSLPVIVVLAVAVFALLLVMARAARGLGRIAGRAIGRVLPARVAIALGGVLAVWLSVSIINSVVVGRIAGHLDQIYLAVNDDFKTDVPAPTLPELSAGPGSLVTWAQLGRQGRIFISNAPTAAAITEFSGSPSEQPIRVYVGAGSAGGAVDLNDQAAKAVAELERTGAFDRAVLNVATGTGRGWVNENQARAVEYMWGGDTATVSVQYSYLPSWMSYLVDTTRAREAGRILFDAVYERWAELPAGARPLLVVSGESLGSFGSEAAFSGAQDLALRTSGGLWVGPTANNELWRVFTDDRDAGSPIHLPTYQGGQTVRFSADGDTWTGTGASGTSWPRPHIGYLQHANDPVTWLDFGYLLRSPEWLAAGERGPGVPDQMVWIPVVTVLQLAVDQLATGIPDGQGHEFGQAPARAWAQILPPAGWTDADTDRLAAELATLRVSDIG